MPYLAFIPVLLLVTLVGLVLALWGLIAFRRTLVAGEACSMQGGAPAGFAATLRAVPLQLVVGLDLLDLGLDVLAAPVVWLLLDRAGLKPLRSVATVEALIPFTQPIPMLTLSWLAVRVHDTVKNRIPGARGGQPERSQARPRVGDEVDRLPPRRRVANLAG